MNLVNAEVTIVRQSTDWEGNISKSAVGTYDVWVEERKSIQHHQYRRDVRGFIDEVEVSKGMFFLWSDVDLTNTVAVIDGSSFTVFNWDRFTKRKRPGDDAAGFHHIEAFYK